MQELTKCRICKGSKLKPFLDLGNQPLANAFLSKKDLSKKEDKYPLKVLFCEECNLCQLSCVVSPEILFRNYVYFSSGMPVLPQHFQDYADEIHHNYISSDKNLVVELGSNDGILLLAIQKNGAQVLGVDPAENIAKIANKRGVKTIPDFFSEKLSKDIKKQYGNAKVIIGNNVVAHINDHHDLVKGIKNLLSKDGVFILEAPYLVDMFENYTFDTIYHEHLSYLAIRPLMKLFDQYDMEIIDVKIYPVQGNSIRVHVANKGQYQTHKRVSDLVKKEKALKLDQFSTYQDLARTIGAMKEDVLKILLDLKSQGKTIAGYGAPAKGNTLLNYYGIDTKILDYATEGLPSKIGTYTPGTHIPVVDINKARQNPPDYYLLLAWNYKDAIMEKEKEFLKSGGKFIMPVGNEFLDSKIPSKKTKSRKKIVLLTGGAGYIGVQQTKALLEAGYNVRVLDHLIFTDKYLEEFKDKIELIQGDIRSVNKEVMNNVTAVIHLAGFSTEPTSQYDPRLTDMINHIATDRLARLAKEAGVQRFIYASTCSIYFTFNTPLTPPLYKETDTVNPISSYSITKRCSEQALLNMESQNFRPTIFRKGTLYGYSPKMRYDLVFNSFTKDAFLKKQLTVDAGGEIWRPMIDIQDLTRVYIQAIELPLSKVGGQIFNIADENWRIGNLAKKIQKTLKKEKNIDITLDIKPYGLTRNYKVDNSKFIQTFKFKPTRNMNDVLLELWHQLENYKHNPENKIFYNDKWYQEYFLTKEGQAFKNTSDTF